MSGPDLKPRIAPPRLQYCTRCLYPAVTATPLTFDAEGVCSGCRTHDEQKSVDWAERAIWFSELCDKHRSRDGSRHDCLIPVSGGKDSFYQVHLLKVVHGMNPLLVTYNENNETDVGKRNIQRMKDVFGCDYYNFTPSVHVLKKMNLAAQIQFINQLFQAFMIRIAVSSSHDHIMKIRKFFEHFCK